MIYLIHFDEPYHHASHYVGFCADGTLDERLARHRAGRGSRLMLAVELAGLGWTVALTHPGDRRFERTLKRAKNTPRFCPICRRQRQVKAPTRGHQNNPEAEVPSGDLSRLDSRPPEQTPDSPAA